MKLLATLAAIALITAAAAYAQSENSGPTNLIPSTQEQNNAAPAAPSSKPMVKNDATTHSASAAQSLRARQDAAERPITAELNRQQLANRPDTSSAPQTATMPSNCMQGQFNCSPTTPPSN